MAKRATRRSENTQTAKPETPVEASAEAAEPSAAEAAETSAPPPPSLVSCSPHRLYGQGGFFEDEDVLREWRLSTLRDRFVTDLGELSPAFAYPRPLGKDRLTGRLVTLDQLAERYSWVNQVFTRGAASRVFRLNDVFVHRNAIYAIIEDQVVAVYETDRQIDRPHIPALDLDAAQLRAAAVEVELQSPSLYVGSVGSANYHHWMLDDLPRVLAANLVLRETGQACSVLLPGYDPRINVLREQSVQAMSQPGEPILTRFVPSDQVLHFETLYYASPTTYHPTLKSPDACRAMRERVWSYPFLPRPSHSRRIALWENTPAGTPANARLLAPVLRDAGLDIVQADGMSFYQLAALFRDATLVVSCMSPMMGNAVLAAPGTPIVMLAAEKNDDPFAWDLAAACGYEYYAVHGPLLDPAAPPHAGAFTIEPHDLAETLSRFGRA